MAAEWSLVQGMVEGAKDVPALMKAAEQAGEGELGARMRERFIERDASKLILGKN